MIYTEYGDSVIVPSANRKMNVFFFNWLSDFKYLDPIYIIYVHTYYMFDIHPLIGHSVLLECKAIKGFSTTGVVCTLFKVPVYIYINT